jgi:hypothetical protein
MRQFKPLQRQCKQLQRLWGGWLDARCWCRDDRVARVEGVCCS